MPAIRESIRDWYNPMVGYGQLRGSLNIPPAGRWDAGAVLSSSRGGDGFGINGAHPETGDVSEGR